MLGQQFGVDFLDAQARGDGAGRAGAVAGQKSDASYAQLAQGIEYAWSFGANSVACADQSQKLPWDGCVLRRSARHGQAGLPGPVEVFEHLQGGVRPVDALRFQETTTADQDDELAAAGLHAGTGHGGELVHGRKGQTFVARCLCDDLSDGMFAALLGGGRPEQQLVGTHSGRQRYHIAQLQLPASDRAGFVQCDHIGLGQGFQSGDPTDEYAGPREPAQCGQHGRRCRQDQCARAGHDQHGQSGQDGLIDPGRRAAQPPPMAEQRRQGREQNDG